MGSADAADQGDGDHAPDGTALAAMVSAGLEWDPDDVVADIGFVHDAALLVFQGFHMADHVLAVDPGVSVHVADFQLKPASTFVVF